MNNLDFNFMGKWDFMCLKFFGSLYRKELLTIFPFLIYMFVAAPVLADSQQPPASPVVPAGPGTSVTPSAPSSSPAGIQPPPSTQKPRKMEKQKTGQKASPVKPLKPAKPLKKVAGKTSQKKKKVPPIPLSRNGPDALNAYRHSWNPITGGPEFLPQADSLPEGELNGRMFFYSRFTEAQYTDSGGIQGLPNGYYETQLLLLGAIYYGLTSNDELILLPSMISTFSTSDGESLYGTGFNDFTFGIKHRWVIQDPNGLRPSIATPFLITLPTTTWFNTPVPKGGLPPLSVVPSTHFGSYALTTGLFIRKNVKPFRMFSDFFYTFNFPTNGVLPGATAAQRIQYGDLAQYRFGVEDVFNDKTGFGGILEFVGLSGLPFSIDGIAPSITPTSFNLMGLQPTIEYNLTSRLMFSAGVLLPVFGTNEYMAVIPNFSMWYYWGSVNGQLMAR